MVGATLSLAGAGRAAQFWPPQLAEGEPEETADHLFAASEELLRSQGVQFVQSFLPSSGGRNADRVIAHGFRHACELSWLACPASRFPAAPPTCQISFAPFDGDHERLAQIVDLTYIGTLDCPQLNHQRETLDVLAGYRATGGYRPDRWYYVRQGVQDVGCLLMSHREENNQAEVLYYGLAPAWRGRGWGLQITRYAQWIARTDQRQRMTISVDAANAPALRVYEATGFTPYDRRSVFWKRLTSA